jgi:hypothetical protein
MESHKSSGSEPEEDKKDLLDIVDKSDGEGQNGSSSELRNLRDLFEEPNNVESPAESGDDMAPRGSVIAIPVPRIEDGTQRRVQPSNEQPESHTGVLAELVTDLAATTNVEKKNEIMHHTLESIGALAESLTRQASEIKDLKDMMKTLAKQHSEMPIADMDALERKKEKLERDVATLKTMKSQKISEFKALGIQLEKGKKEWMKPARRVPAHTETLQTQRNDFHESILSPTLPMSFTKSLPTGERPVEHTSVTTPTTDVHRIGPQSGKGRSHVLVTDRSHVIMTTGPSTGSEIVMTDEPLSVSQPITSVKPITSPHYEASYNVTPKIDHSMAASNTNEETKPSSSFVMPSTQTLVEIIRGYMDEAKETQEKTKKMLTARLDTLDQKIAEVQQPISRSSTPRTHHSEG